MVDQFYGETWLTSMVKVRCQDDEPGLGLGLGFWKAVGAGYWYIQTEGPSPNSGQVSNSVAGFQRGKGDIHGDGDGSGHRYVLRLVLGNC